MIWYDLAPVPKPRQTQADRWKKRPPVLRYRAFADEVKLLGIEVPDRVRMVFQVKMPASWSKAKRARMVGGPHTQRPDIDNYIKALFDAVHKDDAHIWRVQASKIWGETGRIGVGEIE